ncbi:6122_t:CDS:2, partial [Diversispora eburnea]
VNSERTRAKDNFETYWNGVIDACKIKQNILAYEKEKEHIQLEHLRKLNEIDKKIEMENIELIRNSNKWKDGNSRLQYQNDVTTYIRSANRPQLQSNVMTFDPSSNATILNELDQDALCQFHIKMDYLEYKLYSVCNKSFPSIVLVKGEC